MAPCWHKWRRFHPIWWAYWIVQSQPSLFWGDPIYSPPKNGPNIRASLTNIFIGILFGRDHHRSLKNFSDPPKEGMRIRHKKAMWFLLPALKLTVRTWKLMLEDEFLSFWAPFGLFFSGKLCWFQGESNRIVRNSKTGRAPGPFLWLRIEVRCWCSHLPWDFEGRFFFWDHEGLRFGVDEGHREKGPFLRERIVFQAVFFRGFC